jgi:hypothetical protein
MRALAARIREEDMKRQTELYKLRNPSPESTPELASEDEMNMDETDNPGDIEGADDTGDVSDNGVVLVYSKRHDAGAAAVTVDMKADFDTELDKLIVPDSVASTKNLGLPSRKEYLDDDAVLPSTEEADEPTEMVETAGWKSMGQLSHWREISKDIGKSVLEENNIKLGKHRKWKKRSIKDKAAFKKGQKGSKKIEMRAARIEQGE